MVTRLSAADASFYPLGKQRDPMYVGSLSILRKPRSGLSYESLLATVEHRLPQIPRYRQKVREGTLGLALPVWIDYRDFDITYHIRRSALPSPGSDAQLHDSSRALVDGRWTSRARCGRCTSSGLPRTVLRLHPVSPGAGQRHDGFGDRPRPRRPDPETTEFGEDIWIPAREPSDRPTGARCGG